MIQTQYEIVPVPSLNKQNLRQNNNNNNNNITILEIIDLNNEETLKMGNEALWKINKQLEKKFENEASAIKVLKVFDHAENIKK